MQCMPSSSSMSMSTVHSHPHSHSAHHRSSSSSAASTSAGEHAAPPAGVASARNASTSLSSEGAGAAAGASKQRIGTRLPTPTTITTMASPTSSASSSICSSPPSSSCSECSECDEQQQQQQQQQRQADGDDGVDAPPQEQHRHPRNSTLHRHSSSCRRRHHHHHHHHPILHTTNTASSAGAQNTLGNSNIAQHDQQLFSPITSNGSVISNGTSSSKELQSLNNNSSRPASPLKSSLSSLLPAASSAATVHPRTQEQEQRESDTVHKGSQDEEKEDEIMRMQERRRDQREMRQTGETVQTDRMTAYTQNHSTLPPASRDAQAHPHSSNLPSNESQHTLQTDTSASQPSQATSLEQEGVTTSRPPSNPRKSARRHSENGMKTPDESIYAGLPFISPSTSTSTSSAFAVPPHARSSGAGKDAFAFVAPSMVLRTTSEPASLIHPGTPAISANTITEQQQQGSSGGRSGQATMGIVAPGERRIPNDETRPARRKVHRVDRYNVNERSISSPGLSRSAFTTTTINATPVEDGASGTATAKMTTAPPRPGRDDRIQASNKNTFQRPMPHSDSYFPQATTNTKHINTSSGVASDKRDSAKATGGEPAQLQSSTLERDNAGASNSSSSNNSMSIDHLTSSSSSLSSSTTRPSSSYSSMSAAALLQQNEKQRQQSHHYAAMQLKEIEKKMPHMDIATFPTNTLLQLLAALLNKITAVNDAIRDGENVAPHSSSSSSSSAASQTSDGKATDNARRRTTHEGDVQMEGDDANAENGGTTTPPGQYGHSRNTSNEPVTPAVPFSSPALSRNASSSSAAKDGDNGRSSKQDEDAFASDARLTQTSEDESERNRMALAREKGKEEREREKIDEALKPRHNFYRPTSPSSSTKPYKQQQNQAGRTKPLRSNSHTILTSAAQALATPNATLCFHARNIPSISIEAYLVRISKYCPTTNEVFISLLVYFDRMSRLPNLSNLTSSLPSSSSISNSNSSSNTAPNRDTNQDSSNVSTNKKSDFNSSNSTQIGGSTSGSSGSDNVQKPPHPSSNTESIHPTSHSRTRSSSNPVHGAAAEHSTHIPSQPQHSTFAVDSFNIHRLIIAGVTVASKFFSDVFYTNSRYAKVGGLPLTELNALELQFLLLNGFDLIVSPEELQRYADYLLTGALPPLATDSSDRFGSRTPAASSVNGLGLPTTTPSDTPPASRATTPSRSAGAAGTATGGHGLFGLAVRQNRQQHEYRPMSSGQSTFGTSQSNATSYHAPSTDVPSQQANSSFPPGMMDTSSRPKTSSRSASESSTSASEASTVVPSESSVDTERGEVDHSTADEDTGADDDEEVDGDSRMTDVSGAPSPAVVSHAQSFGHMQQHAPQQSLPSNSAYPSNATLGADRDGFAIPARPRPPLSRTSSGSNGQRHPLLATSSGSKTPSNGGSSGGHSSGGKTSSAHAGGNSNTGTKASAGKASTTKGNVSMHRRDNSRTREWTLQQQQQVKMRSSGMVDEDAEMADQE